MGELTEEEEEPEEEEKEEAEPEEEEKEEEEEVDPCDLTEHGFEFYANKDSPMHKVEEVEADGVTYEPVIVLKSGNPLKDPTDLVEFATECRNEFPCTGFYTDARLTNVVSQAMMNATQTYKGHCIGLYVRVSEEQR